MFVTCRIPGTHDDATIGGCVLDLPDDLSKLVNALASVVCVAVLILGTKVSPLESVDRTQITDLAVGQTDLVQVLARAIAVPDLDALLGQAQAVGVALDKPEQLLKNCAEKNSLGGQEWEDVVLEREAHGWWRKDGAGACSGAVCPELAVVHDMAQHVKVLMFFVLALCPPWVDGWREC